MVAWERAYLRSNMAKPASSNATPVTGWSATRPALLGTLPMGSAFHLRVIKSPSRCTVQWETAHQHWHTVRRACRRVMLDFSEREWPIVITARPLSHNAYQMKFRVVDMFWKSLTCKWTVTGVGMCKLSCAIFCSKFYDPPKRRFWKSKQTLALASFFSRSFSMVRNQINPAVGKSTATHPFGPAVGNEYTFLDNLLLTWTTLSLFWWISLLFETTRQQFSPSDCWVVSNNKEISSKKW
jgi:hypothetical protein